MCHHHKRPSDNPRAPKSSDGPTNYKNHGIRRNAADETPELKCSHGAKERPFDIKEGEYPSICRLKSTGGDEISATIPANVGVGVEFIGNARNGLESNVSPRNRTEWDSHTVATIVRSRETRKTDKHMPSVRNESANGLGYSPSAAVRTVSSVVLFSSRSGVAIGFIVNASIFTS